MKQQSNVDEIVGQRLRELRLRQNITQDELARMLGTSRTTITHYEAGRRPMTVSTIVAIAAALKVPPAALLGALAGPGGSDDMALLSEPALALARILSDHPRLVPSVVDLVETILAQQTTKP
ncbi:MAG TPA: helix-turn-helix transcriptional regulator [Roseiflexaceae bacterium]|nr:helix-turn-helix transcriptional regulator [Roseiflexaceae bacterium]